MDWQTLLRTLTHVHWPVIPALLAGWGWAARAGLLIALALLVLWEDWRLTLLAWVATGVAVAALLVGLVPVPWALSRMLAAALDGALFWLAARRWPRPARLGPGGGVWLRLAALAVAVPVGWQARVYAHALWPDPLRADAGLALALAGMLLLALGGDTLHATLGLLLWLNATALFLASLPIPTDWFLLLTLLDITLSAAAAVGLASEGVAVRARRERAP